MYLACAETTVLSMIFIADIRWKFIEKHFCCHQLTPVYFLDIITSAPWSKISEQLIKDSCNKQTR